MGNLFIKHKTWVRIVAIGVVCLFLLNDFAFAVEDVALRKNAYTLSPVSRIRPIITIEDNDGELTIVEDEQERSRLIEGFQEDAGFIYLNTLIAQVLQKFGSRISAEGLKELISKHLSHVDFTNFKWQEIYKEGDVFCLPYARKDDGRTQILKFYLPKDKEVQFPHEVALKFDDGSTAILEDPMAELPEHLKKIRETAASIAGQGILSGMELAERGIKGSASADVKDLSKDGRLSCNMILVEKSERDREALDRTLYDKYQGSFQVVAERREDVEDRILRWPQKELERILGERASHNFIVIIDPAKLHPVSREDVKRVPQGAYRSYIEMRFSYGIRPEAFKAVLIPKELVPIIGNVFPPHVKIIEVNGTRQKELEVLRQEPMMVGERRIGEESRTRMVNMELPDYETALSDYLRGMSRGDKLLTHIVRLTAPSDVEPEKSENEKKHIQGDSSGDDGNPSAKGSGGPVTLMSVALPALATAFLNTGEAIDPLIPVLFGIVALVAIPIALYHAYRFCIGIMTVALGVRERIATEFVLGGGLIAAGIHLGFGQVVPSFTEYIASPLLCSAGACLITFGAYELVKGLIIKWSKKQEDTPNLGSVNSYDLASHELLREHLRYAGQLQAWGQEVEGTDFSQYYHDRLTEAGITLPDDLNLIVIKHNHGPQGSLEQKFLYFEPMAEKWIFSHSGTRKGTGKFVYLTEESLYLLTHNVSRHPDCKKFLEELLMEEYEHATLKLEGRWAQDSHKLGDSHLKEYVEKNFKLRQLRLAEPVATAIADNWTISGSIIELFIDFHLKEKVPLDIEARFHREATEATDLGGIARIMASSAKSPDHARERVLEDVQVMVRYNLAQARKTIDFMDEMAAKVSPEIREGQEFKNLVAFFVENLSDAELYKEIIDDEHIQYDEINIGYLARDTIRFLKSLKQFEHTDIVFKNDTPETTILGEPYLIRWEFIGAVLREVDNLPRGSGKIEIGYRQDSSRIGIEFIAENPAERARWIESVKDKCADLNGAFYRELRKEYRRDAGSCFDASYVLSRVLAEHLGLPIDGDSPDRIEIEVGEYPSTRLLKPSIHAWVIVYRKGERTLLIDPTRGQYDKGQYNKIFVGEYAKAMEELELIGPDELRGKDDYRDINDILFSHTSKEPLDLMSSRVLENMELVSILRNRLDLSIGNASLGLTERFDFLVGANKEKIIKETAFTVAEIKRSTGKNTRMGVRVGYKDESTGTQFDLVLDIAYYGDVEKVEIVIKVSTSDISKVFLLPEPNTVDMVFLGGGKASLKPAAKEAHPVRRGGEKNIRTDEEANEIIPGIFKALGIESEKLEWREEDGLVVADMPVEMLKEQEVKLAFDLPEKAPVAGELLIACHGSSPMFLCLRGKKQLVKIINLMPYYEDLPEETALRIMGRLDAKFPIMEFVGHSPYSYAVFNEWGGLIEITSGYPNTKKYRIPIHVTRIPILPGVYGGSHSSSEISARATVEYAKPGMKVLVVGTGKGLEARIAALRGATVDAVDIRELAVANTKITCYQAGVSDKVNAFCNDLFNGLGKYDLIIFNMPHASDEPLVHDLVTSKDRNTSDFGGALLDRVADEIAKHMALGGKAVLINSESFITEKKLKERTGFSVRSDFFDVAGGSKAYIIERPDSDREKSAGILRLPSPRGHVPDIQGNIERAKRNMCQPLEQDNSTIVSEKDIDWTAINAYMRQKKLKVYPKKDRPVVHVVDIQGENGKDLFGFPLVPGHEEFEGIVPVISYRSLKDDRLHVFMTAGLYDDYLEVSHMRATRSAKTLRIVRLAEILDHEIFEHSEEALAEPEEERHHLAALRAGHFIPRGQKISAFHKWVLDNMALTENGREHIMLMLDEERPEPERSSQRKYERNFYNYAKSVLPREKYSGKVQRAAHHLLRVYGHGDVHAFEELCVKVGVDPKALSKAIEQEEKKHVLNAVEGFKPDIVITETSETNVEIDNTKAIVRKLLKNQYADFVWNALMKAKHGPECMTVLLEVLAKHGKDVFCSEKMEPVIEYAFRELKRYDKEKYERVSDKAGTVLEVVSDYMDQLAILASYLLAQERLGGLIADFTIIDGQIYQEKVTPLTVYLQQLISGTGPFEDLKDKSYENKVRIGWDVLEKYIECIQEIAKRGAVICNVKLTNFGIRENGEVVLFDLGRSSLGWHDRGEINQEFALTLLGTKIAMDARRLENLNAEGVFEETGIRHDFGDDEQAQKLQTELARIWTELISARPIAEGDEEAVKILDGREFVERVKTILPKTPEEAEPEYRRITFIPNEIAGEEILQVIMKEIDDSKTETTSSLPQGSIHGVFTYLCENNVINPETSLPGDLIANGLDRQFGTIKYDLRALFYHLHLIEKADVKETGKSARYYVPERVKKKAARILPVLTRFVGEDRVPKVTLLDKVYEEEIAPILQALPQTRCRPKPIEGKAPIILILGWPGSGKTTLGRSLSQELGVPHISIGTLIAQERERNPDFDPALLNSNDYVYGELLENALGECDLTGGVIIDNSPRTPDAINALKEILEAKGLKLGAIIELTISRRTAGSRMVKRSREEGRNWDRSRKVRRKKMDMYRKMAMPQLDQWRKKGLVCSLDAEVEPWILEARALGRLNEKGVVSLHPQSDEQTHKPLTPIKEEGSIELAGKKFRLATIAISDTYKSLEVFDEETGKRVGFFYAMVGDETSPHCADVCGIRGIHLKPQYRGLGLSAKMMEIFFQKFREVNLLLDEIMNPMLIHMAKEHFGFLPVNPVPENRVYINLKQGRSSKPKIWIPEDFLRRSYSMGPPETMRKEFEVLQEEPDNLDDFEKVYFRTAYKRVYHPGLRLEGVDAVITDFDGVDRDHSMDVVSEETIAAKRGLSRRGVHNITITGLEQGKLFRRFGGAKRAGKISTRDDYIALSCSGAVANQVTKDGQIKPLAGFKGVSLGDRKTKQDIARIARKALLIACREAGIPQ
jgi:adenylate kinase